MANPLVQFRTTDEDVDRIEQARRRRGMTRADWLRAVVSAATAAELGESSGPRHRADPYDALRSRVGT